MPEPRSGLQQDRQTGYNSLYCVIVFSMKCYDKSLSWAVSASRKALSYALMWAQEDVEEAVHLCGSNNASR